MLPSTAWAMATWRRLADPLRPRNRRFAWSVAWSPAYDLLLYLAVFGSVIAFGLYFTIARARGMRPPAISRP